MIKVTDAKLQDSAWIFMYSSAAKQRDDFQDLRRSIIYTHEQNEQYATVCKNVNVGRRFSSKRRRYRFFWGSACTAASHLACWPTHTCCKPTASWTSSAMMARIAFPTIRHATSPIPIGRTPGHLSNVINLEATNALRPMGSTYEVHIRLPTKAMAVHNSLKASWKDEHMPFDTEESILDRAAAPEVLSAVQRMKDPFKSSKITGWCSLMGSSGRIMADGTIGIPGGRISLTVSDPFRLAWLSMCRIPPLLWLETWCSAALTLPSIISLVNVRAVCASVFCNQIALWSRVHWKNTCDTHRDESYL